MILGIGTDIVKVERFVSWADYSRHKLTRVFSPQELDDSCAAHKTTVTFLPEKLAARFAAKEAYYKALSSALKSRDTKISHQFSLLSLCPYVSVIKDDWGIPSLHINPVFFKNISQEMEIFFLQTKTFLSLSHEKEFALAYVIIEQ